MRGDTFRVRELESYGTFCNQASNGHWLTLCLKCRIKSRADKPAEKRQERERETWSVSQDNIYQIIPWPTCIMPLLDFWANTCPTQLIPWHNTHSRLKLALTNASLRVPAFLC